MINYFNLEYSRDTTCLATRVKNNQTVNKEILKSVCCAEKAVKQLVKQDNILVRFDNYTATIRVDNPFKLLNEKIKENIREKLS